MEFPVDLLETADPDALEQSAKDYMSNLFFRNPGIHETLRLPDSREIEIDICNMGFMPLYGVNIKQKILALFSPEDRYKAVGLYLLGQWWSAEDILKTADPSRTGLLKVGTTGERIVLYVLNRIIYRTKENSSDDVPFLCHEEHEFAKILWKDGEAIGFYSVKPEGSLCSSFLTQCYQLPVMDTIFVRRCHRGKGYGLQMLEDFVSSFKKDRLGLKYPLSRAMYKVCKNYLSTYPEDEELLWEVEGTGTPFQRTLIARKLQKMELKGGRQVVGKLNFETEVTDLPMEEVTTKVQKNMEYTVEIVEEVVQIKITKEAQDIPVTTRGRSSQKRKKLGGDTEATTEKIIRVEDIEAGVQSPVESMPVVVQSVEEADLKKRTVTVTHGEENVLGVTPVHCEEQEELTAEPKECVQEACVLTRPTTVTPEEALEETELLQMTPITEIQSMDTIEKTQIVKSFEATTGLVSLQPLEFQQVVEMEIVKKTSGVEDIQEKMITEVTEIKDRKGDAEEEMDAVSEVEEVKLTNEEITCLQTELDLKPVTMSSEDSSTTETGVLRRSSRISTATSQRKFTRAGKVGQQEENAQALDKPENEKDTEIIYEGITPEQSEIENKQGTSVNFAVDQAEEEEKDNEAFEELLLQKKQPDVTGTMAEDGEFKPAEKGRAEKAEVEKIGESENVVVVVAEKTGEKNNENMETDEGLNECAVLLLSEQEHMERVQEEEHIRDTCMIQESICEKEKETEAQKSSHDDDDEVKSDKWPELIVGDGSEKAGNSCSTGRHAKTQSSNDATTLRRSERFIDQYVEGELTRRALRSGENSVTAISKQRCVQHLKVMKQHDERSQAVVDTMQKEDIMKPCTRVTEVEEQKEEKIDTVSITSDGENRTDIVMEEGKVEKDFELGTSNDHDLNKVENKTKDSSHNETTEAGDKITVMHFDEAKTEKKTRQMDQMEETSTGMPQKDAGQNVVESTSVFTLQQAAVVLMDFNQISTEQIGIKETTKEISQSQEEADEKKVVKKTDSVVEPAEKQDIGNETSIGRTSLAEVAEEEMRGEDLMTESPEGMAAELGADRMLIVDSEQEESMSAEENKDDAVREITLEEESAATVVGNTAEVCTNENEAPQKEDHESIRAGNDKTVQENSPKEETPLITSRSLRRRTVTIKPPPQRKCLQKTGDATDSTDKGIIKEAGANKDDKMETEDSAVSKGEDRVQESTDIDEDQIEVVQEEEPMKKTEPLEPINEETENKDVSKPSQGDEEEKSDNRTESIEEKDLDKADNSSLTEKSVDNRNSNLATPLRRSQRFKDQPAEVDLTKRVLRSGTKSVTTISKQMHVQHAKSVKPLKESMGEPEAEQKKEVMDSHSGFAEGEKMETVSVTNDHDETLIAVQDSVQGDKVEKEYLDSETADDHVLNEAENKMEDSETTRDAQRIAGMDLEDSDIVKDTVIQVEGKTTQQPVGESAEEQDEEPATEMAQKDDGQNVVQSTSVFMLQQTAVVFVDCNKVSPQKTDGSDNDETLLSLDQTEYLVEQTENKQRGGSETSTETGQKGDGLNKARVSEEDELFTRMGVEEPIEENPDKQVVEMGTDNMPETNSNEEKTMSTEEQVIIFEEESGKTADVYISESEKNEKGDQMETLGHEETVQESLPEEGTPVITSRTLRRRTVAVKSLPQQKSKCPQKTVVEIAELENVQMAEDIMDKGISDEKGENNDENTQDSAVDSAEDQSQKPAGTDQGQMEVVQEDPVKDNSTPQNVPVSEESTIKEVTESRPADESEVSDNNFAEVEKDAEIEDKAQEASEPVENQTDEAAIAVPGEGEQKADETTKVVKLQKASVVLVDFNKVSPQVTTEDTLQPQEKECEEPDKPADVSMHIDEITPEEQMMKQTDVQVKPTEEEKAEVQVNTAIGDNKSTEGISEKRDENNDEKMETEEDGVKEDKGRLPEVVQEKELVKETTTVQEIPCETEVQEPSQADKEKSDSQTELSKADPTIKQCDNEISAVATPKKHSRQPVDQPAVSELTTRVLRSSTKQAIACPSQRYTRHSKAKMQIDETEQAVDEPEKKREGDKIETVNVATVATPNLTSTLECRVEESKVDNGELRAEIIEDSESREEETHPPDENTVDDDIRIKQCSESDQVTTEDVVLEEAAEATTGKEKIVGDHVSAIPKHAEIEVEGSIAQTGKEQDEALVSETAQKEEGQNAVDSALGFTLQNAAVVLVDFNKVQPKIISNSENTGETSQSQEEADKQINIGEDKEDEEMEQTESLVETAKKEKTDENKTTETTSQEKEGLNSTVLEEKYAFAVTNKGEPMTEILEETPMDVGADSTLKTGSEQETSVLAEEKGKDDKVRKITLEEESAATVSEKVAAVKKCVNHGESVQEEETPIITSRSLRRRTITVKSSPQIKSKLVQKSSVQEEMKKAEVDKETDINKAEKTPSVCISVEVEMPKTNPEDSTEDGKVTSEMEKQEQISEQREVEALTAEEIPEAELQISEDMADGGNAIINESEDKEKGEMPSDTAVSIEVDIIEEEEKAIEEKSTENTENTDGEMVSLVQDSVAQEKESEMLTGSPANVVVEGITQSEQREVDKNEEEDSSHTSLSKPARENTEEEASDEEKELIFTKNLRRRTVTVQTPMRRKHKHLTKEVVDSYTEKPQPEKGELSREPSDERKTVEGSEEPITALEEKKETTITETDPKDKSGDAQVSSEEMSKETVTIDKHEDKNSAETDGEMVENIADQEKEKMEERTENVIHEKEENTDVIENNLQKEPDKVETVNANPEQENVQQQNAPDIAEEHLLEETSEAESRILEEEKEEKGKMSTTEEIPEVEEEVGVTRRSLRKRTITIKATPERKSKRLRKQDQDVDLAEEPTDEPVVAQATVESHAEKQATETQATSQEQCDSDNEREMLSEKSQEQENQEGEETYGETSPEKEEDQQAQLRELINVSTEETDTKMEARDSDKGEVEEENKAEADDRKEGAAEHDTVQDVEEKQDNTEPNEKNGKECGEISLAIDGGFTLELDEEDENSSPEKSKLMKETEASLTEHPDVASTSIQNMERYEELVTDQEEQPAVKKKQVLQESSATAASPDRRPTRRSKRFPRESQGEMEATSEAEAVIDEDEEKKISQQKRKAIVDLTPRRSKRLVRPKMV